MHAKHVRNILSGILFCAISVIYKLSLSLCLPLFPKLPFNGFLFPSLCENLADFLESGSSFVNKQFESLSDLVIIFGKSQLLLIDVAGFFCDISSVSLLVY